LLYLFGSDLLQSVINDLLREGAISRPINTDDMDFPVILMRTSLPFFH
jgi:hypothetical protein